MSENFIIHPLFWKITGSMAAIFTLVTGYHFKRFADLENEINACKEGHLSTGEFRTHFDGLREEQRTQRTELKEAVDKIDLKIDRVFDKLDDFKKERK